MVWGPVRRVAEPTADARPTAVSGSRGMSSCGVSYAPAVFSLFSSWGRLLGAAETNRRGVQGSRYYIASYSIV